MRPRPECRPAHLRLHANRRDERGNRRESRRSLFESGGAFYARADYDRAIADFDEAIRLDPKYGANFGNRGNANFGKGDFRRAIADYDEAIRLDPKDEGAYNNRGCAQAVTGSLVAAEADFKRASELGRADPGAECKPALDALRAKGAALASAAIASPCKGRVLALVAEEYGKRPDQVSSRDKFAVDGPRTIEDVEIKQLVEEKFGVKIPDAEWNMLTYVGDIDDYLQSHVAACR